MNYWPPVYTIVQVYNLIISPPLASYLHATRFRLAMVYVARRTSICIMRARSLAYVHTYSMYYVSGATLHCRVASRRIASHRLASPHLASPRVGVSEATSRQVLVIDSGSDYLWLHALLDRCTVLLSSRQAFLREVPVRVHVY